MKQTLPLSTNVHLDKMKILQSDKMKQNKRPAMKSMSASLFCRGLIRSKVGAKSVGHMFWPWYANHVFASPQGSRHCTAFWAMFSGVLLPEYPCKYPTDSSATARPPALFGLKKPWYIEGKARGIIGWITVRRHPAEPRQPVQQFLKFHKLSYYSPCCRRSSVGSH